jgi:CP family cyanate transporter-like MFS transporter
VLIGASVLLIAANLRPAATTVGPLIHRIRADAHLSATEAGFLVTLPVLCFGLLAPLGSVLTRRLGLTRAIATALTLLVTGLLVRFAHPVGALFAGTAIAGAGIAVGNVLIPVLVKRSFGASVGLISGAYVTTMIASAAVAAGAAVPLTNALGAGWRVGLGVWAIPASLALAVWLLQLRGRRDDAAVETAPVSPRALAHNLLAWQLAVFFGAQACGFYVVLSWLPSIYGSHGIGSTLAGVMLSVCMIVGLPCALLVPALATRLPRQSALAAGFSLVTCAGFVGLLLAPASGAWIWAVLIGIGQGACFPLALTMIVLRSPDAAHATGLSTLVQSAGYLLAACGPLLVGLLHDTTGSWVPGIVFLVALTVPQVAAGLGAGRDLQVSAS